MTLDEAIKNAEAVANANERLCETVHSAMQLSDYGKIAERHRQLADWLKELKWLRKKTRWIPVSEGSPEDLEVVNITWVNHKPEPYYCDIKDKPFTATGIYFKKQWYWWSTVCADYLREYGSNDMDKVDAAIEIIAWCPLPEPYKAERGQDDD